MYAPGERGTRRASKSGVAAAQTLRSPLLLNTQAIRFAWAAAVSPVGNGELSTCSTVKLRFCAGANTARKRTRMAVRVFISAQYYQLRRFRRLSNAGTP